MRSIPRRLAALLLLAVVLSPLGARQPALAAQDTPAELAQTVVRLTPVFETEGANKENDTPQTARAIGTLTATSWSQVVQGTIGRSDDLDYFKFSLTQPASSVKLNLSGLVADYDLVLANDPPADQGYDPGQSGLEDIAQVGGSISAIGGSISAIGGSISAIGGSISAIGGSISAIGGSISAIGGSISAISANSGSKAEQIDTFLWLPGDYYAVVASNNGDFGDTRYTLSVEVQGSGLVIPPPAPEVELRVPAGGVLPEDVTTLYIFSEDRMLDRYPGSSAAISSTINSLNILTDFQVPPNPNGAGPEHGIVIDLSDMRRYGTNAKVMASFYAAWDEKASNPLAANYIAGIIDNVIEAATTDGLSGPGAPTRTPQTPFYLGPSDTAPVTVFPNVRNIVLVGGDNIIPGFRLPDLTTIANESEYLKYLQAIPGQNGVIDPASAQGAAQRYRMITSDNPYGSGRPYRFYGFPFFLPNMAVGRLVESPDDVAAYLKAYTFFDSTYSPDFSIDPTTTQRSPDPGGTPPLPNKAFVSGYDFLKDQAGEVTRILSTATAVLTPAQNINTLINDSWTATELAKQWGDGEFDTNFSATQPNDSLNLSPVSLFSVNSHFDHWRVLPADNSAGNFPAARLLAPSYFLNVDFRSVPGAYFRTTLGYSVGCHSGYNVLGRSLAAGADSAIYSPDFAQALNRHGGNWVGNTGYGYGTADGIDYTERLATLFTEELARDVAVPDFPVGQLAQFSRYVGQSIGDAHMLAKQRYVRNSTSLSPYDFKATHIWTLYGLPFIRVTVDNPIAPPAEDPNAFDGNLEPLEASAPYRGTANSLGRLTRTITFSIDLDDANDRSSVARTGSTVLNLDVGDFTITDEFVVRGAGDDPPFPQPGVRVFNNNQIGAPTLPTFAYDISASSQISVSERLRVKDVIFLGGVYGQEGSFNPQITQIVTETDDPIVATNAEPSFAEGVGIWYPDKFFAFSSVGDEELQRDQLVAAAAQFRAGPDGQTGTIRPYSQMVFQVIYDDPGVTDAATQSARSDDDAPVIESVEILFDPGTAPAQLAQAQTATVEVTAFDLSIDDETGEVTLGGIQPSDISAVYARGDTWVNISFVAQQQPDGSTIYRATLPVDEELVRVIVRVTDKAGNTSYYTAKGSFQPPPDRFLLQLPLLRK